MPELSPTRLVDRIMTAAEKSRFDREREECGAVGKNVVVCRCGRMIEHFPNGPVFSDCLFEVGRCDWCVYRVDPPPDPPRPV